jgi:hypothetical protein
MSIHPVDLLDLPTLYHYRSEAISLDSARLLTRGNPLGAIGVMAYVNPGRHIYSAVCRDGGEPLFGGIIHTNGEAFAKLLYLAPAAQMGNHALPALVENLASEAGTWGALHVLAEVDENSEAFAALRMAGFSVYAWQRMWDVTDVSTKDSDHKWLRVESVHLPAIQNLYHQIIPPLLQAVEPAPKRAIGFITDEGVKGHVGTFSGMLGIVLFPLIHPETVDVGAKLAALIQHLPNRGGRPLYLCVRSYQAWLEPVLEDLGAKAGARQAIMVKHLARLVKDEQAVRAKQPANVSVQPSRMSRMENRKS